MSKSTPPTDDPTDETDETDPTDETDSADAYERDEYGSIIRGPPNGHEYGERTTQSVDYRAPEYWQTDAEEIRQKFGIARFDVEEYLDTSKLTRMCYPDAIIHERDPELTTSTKGTDVLFKGDRDSGKTTLARQLAIRLMERGERVLWRGRSDGSGWLPLRHWTTLYLPANAEIDANWMNEGEDAEIGPATVADVVREVVYYEDVFDLLDALGERNEGTFNVVYPDPSFAGCEKATEDLENVAGRLPFTPEWEADDPADATPLIQWWFGFWFARKEHGPFVWMSLIFDEVGDWLEEGARQDASRLYDKIKSLRKVWAASRKRLMSMYFFAHKEKNVHWMVREEFKWRVHMPDDSPNPHQEQRSTIPQGFDTVPMYHDIMSDKPVGVGLCYTQKEFAFFRWSDLDDDDNTERWLKLRLCPPEAVTAATDETEAGALTEPEYDEEIFTHWQNGIQSRLVVNEPGAGYVDCRVGDLSDGATSPVDALAFAEIETSGGVAEVFMEPTADGAAVDGDTGDDSGSSIGDEPICVARFRLEPEGQDGPGGGA